MEGKSMYVEAKPEDPAILLGEEDRPTAGTKCRVCKEIGHFCQATTYSREDDTLALCGPCSRNEWCPVVALVRGTSSKSDPFFVPRSSVEERTANRERLILSLVSEGRTTKEIMHEFPSVSEDEILRARGTPPEPPKLRGAAAEAPKRQVGRPPGVHWKPEQRARAGELLKAGESVREVAASTGLARGTVMSVRREVAAELPKACACGEPFAHPGWCSPRLSRGVVDKTSLSPVVQGKRATYVLSKETRDAIARDTESDRGKLAEKYACSRATVDNIRKAAGTYQPNTRREPEPKKMEDVVIKPVTTATVSFRELIPTIKSSIYEQAVRQAEEEIKVIGPEIERLHKRRDALNSAVEALKSYIQSERTTL